MNLRDYIRLPSEYAVRKKLTKERFLKSGNLTGFERDLISRLVLSIDLLYDVVFPDKSEIILIDVPIIRRESFETDKRIAQVIAQAIPYPCITHVHADGFGEVSVFLTRQNSNDQRRRVIEKQTSSPIFDLQNPPTELCTLFDKIEFELSGDSENADQAMHRCVWHLENCKKAFKDAHRRAKIAENNQEYEYILRNLEYGADHVSEVLKYDFYRETDELGDDAIAVQLSEEALYNCAFALYTEVSGEFEELDWLLTYVICCNEVLCDSYETPVSMDFIQKLGAKFSTREIVTSDDDCIVAVHERLEEEYELLW